MTTFIRQRGGYSLLQSMYYSLPLNRSYCSCSVLPHYATSMPQPSSDSSSSSGDLYNSRRLQLVNANGKKTFLAREIMRKLEAQDLPFEQIDTIASAIDQCCQENQELREGIEKMHNELQCAIDRLHEDFDKMRFELKYEVHKITFSQHLESNLENERIKDVLAKQKLENIEMNGRINDVLAKQKLENIELNSKLNRETLVLREQLENAKLDFLKYGIGVVLSLSTVGLGIFPFFLRG